MKGGSGRVGAGGLYGALDARGANGVKHYMEKTKPLWHSRTVEGRLG